MHFSAAFIVEYIFLSVLHTFPTSSKHQGISLKIAFYNSVVRHNPSEAISIYWEILLTWVRHHGHLENGQKLGLI